jgi:hypothetical protein
MNAFTNDQKIAFLVVPMLLFGVLGSSTSYAYGRNFTDEERTALEEARDLREQGEFEKAQEVLKEAGVQNSLGRMGVGGLFYEEREAMRQAIQDGDYDSFVAATKDMPFADEVSEKLFETIVAAHSFRQSGNFNAARKLLESEGVIAPIGIGGGGGHYGMGRGGCSNKNINNR